jgi:hypothetical protein
MQGMYLMIFVLTFLFGVLTYFYYRHHSKPPEYILIKISENPPVVHSQGYPPGIFKLTLQKFSPQIRLKDRQFTIKLETFPFIPAYAITVEKAQGSTLDGMILSTLHHESRRSLPRPWLYVGFSRVQTQLDYYLTEPLLPTDVKPPHDHVLQEIERLKNIPSRLSY